MFADGYFAISFEGLVGIVVTIVGLWFVVKQLRETRLASQMEGIMQLGDRFMNIVPQIQILHNLTSSTEWEVMQNNNAHDLLFDGGENQEALQSIGVFYENLGMLVRTQSLDQNVAYQLFGDLTQKRWKSVRKAMVWYRKQIDSATLGEHWEWLSNEFDKMEKN